jgi:uncharacterized protein YqjF (DUF2071 family)
MEAERSCNYRACMIDRLAPRLRPSGFPVLHQRWSRLVFLHWRLAPDAVRALVPAALELDLCEGAAWVSLVAFTVSRMRPTLLPPIPGLSDAHQINVRTYVHRDGVPGLWFFSLDADNPLAVRAARLGYRLAFFDARVHVGEEAGVVAFRSERTAPNAAKATFDAAWQPGDALPVPQPGTLDFFLLERYVLYSGTDDRLLRTRIHHRPWPLRAATLRHLASTMLEAHGLPAQAGAPLTHAQAVPFDVEIWPPMHASA